MRIRRYDLKMTLRPNQTQRFHPIARVLIETAFIVFLFYSNLLMGEFTAANSKGKTFAYALHDIFTATNFAIALISALIGYVIIESLRKKL